MHDYRKLRVWQDAIELAVEVYQFTRTLPAEEKFNLVSQMNRAAVSVGSNIGEGAGRMTNGEFVQFLGFASGSCSEIITQSVICERLELGTATLRAAVLERATSIQKMIHTFIKTLR
ncbi:four helix bundle protein [Hymenobacter weizhouensis]|uniref:four helix bundle protein n=1 Tax=Hymenobacter sp. YIM 151500-1 TaxID=2987689 RepID=UPI002228035C|nr:four helix bundle protein [Hymenobacter sp. YIM 151500-1]UYZ62122.1 four helix bundle protein [Hymenobacter sp. YIM 151500-1]